MGEPFFISLTGSSIIYNTIARLISLPLTSKILQAFR